MPVRAVVFDLFDTLVGSEHLRPCGYHPTWAIADLLSIEPAPFRSFWARTRQERETTPIDLLELVDRYLEPSGRRLDEHERHEVDAMFGVGRDDALRQVEPAIVDLVTGLSSRAVIGVLSNCDTRSTRAWPTSPLAAPVHTFVRSCDIGVLKPALGAYGAVLESLGVRAPDAVYVGNGSCNELSGAATFGFAHVIHCNVFDRSNGLVQRDEQRRRATQSHTSVETVPALAAALDERV